MIKTKKQEPELAKPEPEVLDDIEEVLRKTTRGMSPVDITYVEFGDDYGDPV